MLFLDPPLIGVSTEPEVANLTNENSTTNATLPKPFTLEDACLSITKTLAFAAIICLASVIGSTLWQYEGARRVLLRRRRRRDLLILLNIQTAMSQSGRRRRNVDVTPTTDLLLWWNQLSPGEKVFWPIFGINVVVFLAWKVAAWESIMYSYFSHTPFANNTLCWPMLLSVFSHQTPAHLVGNMEALYIFMPGAADILGTETLVAVYLSSGVVSCWVQGLQSLALGNRGSGLGASGAVMAIIGLTCSRASDTRLGRQFRRLGCDFQKHTDKILTLQFLTAFLGVVSELAIGQATGIGHAAHLAGMVFGIACGIWEWNPCLRFMAFKDTVLTKWHAFRIL